MCLTIRGYIFPQFQKLDISPLSGWFTYKISFFFHCGKVPGWKINTSPGVLLSLFPHSFAYHWSSKYRGIELRHWVYFYRFLLLCSQGWVIYKHSHPCNYVSLITDKLHTTTLYLELQWIWMTQLSAVQGREGVEISHLTDSLRTNTVSKLTMTYTNDAGGIKAIFFAWNHELDARVSYYNWSLLRTQAGGLRRFFCSLTTSPFIDRSQHNLGLNALTIIL